GAILGSWASGIIIDQFFTQADGNFNWEGIWMTFAAYALVVTVLFAIFFKHKHNPELIKKKLEN
ncbi:MAG: MFS transporter, partial [Bacteroidales bacterium]|nr:MFS transporter [Bacteroidales bacterium]